MEGYMWRIGKFIVRENVENAEFNSFSLGFILFKLTDYGFMLLEIYRIARRR